MTHPFLNQTLWGINPDSSKFGELVDTDGVHLGGDNATLETGYLEHALAHCRTRNANLNEVSNRPKPVVPQFLSLKKVQHWRLSHC